MIPGAIERLTSDSIDDSHVPTLLDHIGDMCRQPGVWKKLDYLFWRVLCPYPDQTALGMWWYNRSARLAWYFHRKHCKHCGSLPYAR